MTETTDASGVPKPERLTNAEIRKLKAQAQRLETVTRLGRAGLTAAFVAGIDRELAAHELVKVKFTEFREQKHELAAQLATATGSQLIWVIGHVAVLYRKRPVVPKQTSG